MAAAASSLTGDLHIGASAYRGRHGEIRGVNPVSGMALEPGYGLAWHDDVDRAAALADASFDTYRETNPRDRAAFLGAIATNIETVSNELVLRASEESGLPAERMAVGFTGSRRGGVALVAAAAGRPEPIPVFAEMSSVNPVVILPHARRSRPRALGEEFAASMTTGAGQLCTSPGLVFVVDGEGTEQFVQAAAGAIAGSPAAPMLTEEIQAAFSEGAKRPSKTAGVHSVAQGVDNPSIASRCQARLFRTTGAYLLADSTMQQEIFGSASLIVMVRDLDELTAILESLEGQLTLTVHADEDDSSAAAQLMPLMERKAGRTVFNGWPTGVEVGHATVHGGPFPATSDSRTTSVGSLAIERFLRPVSYQNVPAQLLPQGLDDENISALPRRVNGVLTAENDRKDL